MSKFTDVLQRVLGSLSPEDVTALNKLAVRREYPRDTVICREGEVERVFYVIEEGLVSVTRQMANNQEQMLGMLRDGQFFGEMALIDNEPRAATIRTITASSFIEITDDVFESIVARNPEVAVTLLKGITRSLRDTDRIALQEVELKNRKLAQALNDLKAAQSQLLQQERLKRDLEIASDVQRSILPVDFPTIPGFEFAMVSRPAREVGGDFYDVIPITDDRFALVVADVSGKSWQAAMFMALTRALLLREAIEDRSPAETLHRVHRQVLRTSTAEMFVTMFYGVVDIPTRRMSFVRAGHDRPIWYRAADKTLELLSPPGRFIGMWEQLVIEESSITLLPDDSLVCYSDGITDAQNSAGEFFGLERLLALVKQHGHLPSQVLSQKILSNLDDFRQDVPQPDDITILIAKAVTQT